MSDFNSFKGKAGVFASKAAGAARSIAAKTKHIGRIAKLNVDIASEKDAIRRAYEEMGRLYYENHRTAPEGLLAQACQSIDASLAAVAAMEEEIEQLKAKGEEEPAADFQTVVDQTEAEAAVQEPGTPEEEPAEEPDIEVEIEVEIGEDLFSDGAGEGPEAGIGFPGGQEAPEEPVEEELPVEEEASAEEEAPVVEEAPVKEEPPVEEEFPMAEDAPVEEEPPVEEEAPVEEESSVEEEAPAEIPADDEPVEPAIEE